MKLTPSTSLLSVQLVLAGALLGACAMAGEVSPEPGPDGGGGRSDSARDAFPQARPDGANGQDAALLPSTDASPGVTGADAAAPSGRLRVIVGDLPASLLDAVPSATDSPALAPSWSYPEADTLLPVNLGGVAWSVSAPASVDAVLFLFEGTNGSAEVLTRGATLTLDRDTWQRVSAAVGAGVVRVSALGFDSTNPSRVGRAQRSVRVSGAALRGAMYYWASHGTYAPVAPNEDSTSPRGYFRFDFNSATATRASLFLGFNGAGNRCVGCHSLSRDGARMATSFEHDTNWGVVNVASTAGSASYVNGGPTDSAARGNFSAFSPDARYLFTTQDHLLRVFDVSAGGTRQVASFTTPYPPSHVTVAPNGQAIYYVEDLTGTGGTGVGRGQIARVQWSAATLSFSSREVVVSDPSGSVYYPSLAPDGSWMLYNFAAAGTSLSNPGATLRALHLATGRSVELVAANQGAQRSNSWPRWAPFAADDGAGHRRYFFTFSSTRSYLGTSGRPQLWLSGFDPEASAGGDPSSPALWIPAQDSSTNNHAAQWTEALWSNTPSS